MGSGGAKKTNALLEEQQRAAQQAAAEAGGYKREQYGMGKERTGTGEDWLKSMWGTYGIGAPGTEGGGGGGGGPAYTPASFTDATLEFYKKMMEEGGYSPEQQANILSYSAAPITGMYSSLSNKLGTLARGAGVGGGYTSGIGNLMQDKAYQASELAKGVSAGLAEKILASRFQGAGGLEDIETKRRAFEEAERARAAAAAAARAGAGRASSAQRYSQQMGIIKALLGIGDTSLEWGGQQLSGIGRGTESASARRDETPMWQKMAAGALQAGAGAAAGAFTGGLSSLPGMLKKKSPMDMPVAPSAAELEYMRG